MQPSPVPTALMRLLSPSMQCLRGCHLPPPLVMKLPSLTAPLLKSLQAWMSMQARQPLLTTLAGLTMHLLAAVRAQQAHTNVDLQMGLGAVQTDDDSNDEPAQQTLPELAMQMAAAQAWLTLLTRPLRSLPSTTVVQMMMRAAQTLTRLCSSRQLQADEQQKSEDVPLPDLGAVNAAVESCASSSDAWLVRQSVL